MASRVGKKSPLVTVLWSNDVTGELEEVYLLTSIKGGAVDALAYIPSTTYGSVVSIRLGGSINKKTEFWVTSDYIDIGLYNSDDVDILINNLKQIKKQFKLGK